MSQRGSFNYAQTSTAREVLTAARTYYVSTTGNDAFDGLTPSTAFKTIQHAADIISTTLDMQDKQVTVQVADGTYTSAVSLGTYIGTNYPIIQGNSSTPGNVIISVTSGSCFTVASKSIWAVHDMQLATTTSGNGLVATAGGNLRFSNINFGACASAHMVCTSYGAIIAEGNYNIIGASPIHHSVVEAGYIQVNSRTVTITGTPNFTTAFAFGRTAAVMRLDANTYTGAATGLRYSLAGNGVIYTNNAGASYLPGNSPGTTTTGGQYT